MSSPSVPTPTPHLDSALAMLAAGNGLTESESDAAFGEVMAGRASGEALRTLLLTLRDRGERPEEIAGAVQALRRAMRRVPAESPEQLVDTCGTGGGTVTTINLSTAAAFVAAGAGVRIAKHGNRSFTSRSGSADVLEALGVGIDLTPERAGQVLAEVGIVFLFAPLYHPAMRHVAPIRRELGVQTIMNLVGPLANPALVGRQVVGVADRGRGPQMAGALARLGAKHALVVHAEVGMDEIAPMGRTDVWEVQSGNITSWTFDPVSVGLATTSLDGLAGGEPADNAGVLRRLLETGKGAAALEAAVLLNAGAAIYVGGAAPTLAEGTVLAKASLRGGRAADRLAALAVATR